MVENNLTLLVEIRLHRTATDMDLSLEARAKILKKIAVLLVETMTPKRHFEIN